MRMMFRILVALTIWALASTTHPAKSQACLEDTISRVAGSGKILVMHSGAVYEVLPGDDIDSMLWLPVSDVLVCERSMRSRGRTLSYYEIINLDERGEKVGATRLR